METSGAPSTLNALCNLARDHLGQLATQTKLTLADFDALRTDNRRLRSIKEHHYRRLEAERAPLSKRVNELQKANRETEQEIRLLEDEARKLDGEIREVERKQEEIIQEFGARETESKALENEIKVKEAERLNAEVRLATQRKESEAELVRCNAEYNALEEVARALDTREAQTLAARKEFAGRIHKLQRLCERKNVEKMYKKGELRKNWPAVVSEFYAYRLMEGRFALTTNNPAYKPTVTYSHYNQHTNVMVAVCTPNLMFGVDCSGTKPWLLFTLENKQKVRCIQFSTVKGLLLAALTDKNQILVFNRADKYTKPVALAADRPVSEMRLSGNDRLITIDGTKSMTVWDLNKLEKEKTIPLSGWKLFDDHEKITGIHVDDKQVFCRTDRNGIYLVDLPEGKSQRVLTDPAKAPIVDMTTTDGYRLVVGFENGEIWAFDRIHWMVSEDSKFIFRKFEPQFQSFFFTCGNSSLFVGTDRGHVFCFQNIFKPELTNKIALEHPQSFASAFGYNLQTNSLTCLTPQGDVSTYAAWGLVQPVLVPPQ